MSTEWNERIKKNLTIAQSDKVNKLKVIDHNCSNKNTHTFNECG